MASSNTCENCNESFPNRMEIDGKVRNLYSRKYCLNCSPFGEHNTSQLHKKSKKGEKMECEHCGRKYEYDRNKGHRINKCNSCCVSERRKKKKRKLAEMFGGECKKCGYDECYRVLSFHHRKPEEKDFSPTNCVTTRKWENVVAEAEKCDLLCSNCHLEHHCMYDHEGKDL